MLEPDRVICGDALEVLKGTPSETYCEMTRGRIAEVAPSLSQGAEAASPL